MSKNRKNNYTKTTDLLKILFLFIVFLGIGYAFLDAVLTVDGDTTVTAPELNVYVQSTSVTSGSTSGTPTIIGTAKKEVDFSTSLTNDGSSFFEETSTLINKGTKKAYLVGIDIKVYDSNDNEITLSAPYEYVLTDNSTGNIVEPGHRLAVNDTETYRLRFKYIAGTDMTQVSDYPEYTFKITYNYTKESFEDDSWDTIKTKVIVNESNYPIGATKTIEMDVDGDNTNETYTLRVANNTTPIECEQTGFSESACGFVVEFADVVSNHIFNPFTAGSSGNGNGTTGGWEYSDIRAYLNNDNYSDGLYLKLPSALRNVIKSTTVVSGHGSDDSSNFTTTDNLYLLNPMETYNANPGNYDTAASYSRQLDYYRTVKVTTTNYGKLVKKYHGADSGWWLGSPMNTNSFITQTIGVGGNLGNLTTNTANGVAPAFRIGNNQ